MSTPQSRSEDPGNEFAFFADAIRRHPDALLGLSHYTIRKYAANQLPLSLRWLLKFPKLLRDLADGAELQARQREGGGKQGEGVEG